jgi:hypothetical protein
MDLPECVEDITQWAFHKGISPGSSQASCAIRTAIINLSTVRGFAGQIVPA